MLLKERRRSSVLVPDSCPLLKYISCSPHKEEDNSTTAYCKDAQDQILVLPTKAHLPIRTEDLVDPQKMQQQCGEDEILAEHSEPHLNIAEKCENVKIGNFVTQEDVFCKWG